jgi:hypothetical protein
MTAGRSDRLGAGWLDRPREAAQKGLLQERFRYNRESYFAVGMNIGQRFQPTPFKNLRELIE